MSDILVEVAEAVPVEVNLPEKDNAIEMEVYYQDEVSLDTDLSLLYIKSGEKEIENYVENVSKPEINDYIETYAKPIVSEVVDNIASPVIDEYLEGTVKPEISRFAAEEMSSYAEVATTQAGIATAAAIEANATSQSVDVKVAEFSEQTEASKQEFIAFAGEKTEEFEQTAQQATADSLANVEHARIWAEGEQAEVKPLGGELSSMGAADLAYALANAPEDTPIDTANMFAMNIFKGEKGDKGDKGEDGKDGLDTFATNCITEIPQDIKLELNNGVLTLRAGSKVYIPNGAGVFDVVNVTKDITLSGASTLSGAVRNLYYINGALGIYVDAHSGTTIPSSGVNQVFYDTSDNTVKVYTNGSVVKSGLSLPIARIKDDGVYLCSAINQIFNGFGYIGSTVFALPNVKGLIPNGRNEDGSLRNIEFATSKVITATGSGTNTNIQLLINANQVFNMQFATLDEDENKLYDSTGKVMTELVVATLSRQSGVITSFTPKNAFQAVDRNDSSWISAQGMPSNKYIDLTLGASGTKYTAPANGYVTTRSDSTGTWSYLHMYIPTTYFGNTTLYTVSNVIGVLQSIPVKKGEIFQLDYDQRTFSVFRFLYAEGENS